MDRDSKVLFDSLSKYHEDSVRLSNQTGAMTALKRVKLIADGKFKEHQDGEYYISKSDFDNIIKSETEHIITTVLQL